MKESPKICFQVLASIFQDSCGTSLHVARKWTEINVHTFIETNFGIQCKSFLIKGVSSQGRFLGRRWRHALCGECLLNLRDDIRLLMVYEASRNPKRISAVWLIPK